MSAIRRSDKRSEARRQNSSPYARPQNSGWSFKKLLEPIRRRVFGQQFEEDSGERGHQFLRSVSPEEASNHDEDALSQISDSSDAQITEPPKSPSATTSPKRPVPVEGSSPSVTLENVIGFLNEATRTSLKQFEAQNLVSLIQKSIPGEQTVSNSLIQSVGRPLSAIEVEGLISFIRKRMPVEKSEPFRFSSTTPSRAGSPFSPLSPSTPTSPTSSPRRILSKNPNGTYRWEGAGSAKQTPRSRNRYASPAFGTSRSTPERMRLRESTSFTDGNRHDGKRRRVVEDTAIFPSNSSSQQQHPFPLGPPSTPRTNGANGAGPRITIPSPSPSRLRTQAIHRPTTPSNPSPLRQAWSGGSSTSQEDLTQPHQPRTTPPKQSKAANLMAELIKEVTPPKKPDLSNPYQTASPVGKVGPPRRSTRRVRATGRATLPNIVTVDSESKDKVKEQAEEDGKQKAKEYPPQAIIEATLPKGSKRSRPPAYFDRSKSPSSNSDMTPPGLSPPSQREQPVIVETRKLTYVVEEVDQDEEDSNRSSKKSKGVNGASLPNGKMGGPPEIFIEVIEDVDMQSSDRGENSSSSTTLNNTTALSSSINGIGSRQGSSSFGAFKSTSIPKEPSKLRFSYQPAEGNSTPPSPTSVPLSRPTAVEFNAPPPPTTSSFTFLPPPPKPVPDPSEATNSPSLLSISKDSEMDDPVGSESESKAKVLAMDRKVLPTFTFTLTPRAKEAIHATAQAEAEAKPVSSLPTFDLSHTTLKKVEKPTVPPPVIKSFDWAAAGTEPPVTNSSAWTCSICMLSNPASATEKCTVCETPRPAAKTEKPAVKGFDWSSAGLKSPTAQSASSWTCSTCLLSNPATATDKCTVCESPR